MPKLLISYVACCAMAAVTCAQTSTGTIQGHVRDTSDAAVPGAAVTVTSSKTGVSVQTRSNTQGEFVVPFLTPADYVVTVEKAGFRRYTESAIRLDVQQVRSLDIKLEIGEVATTVRVEAESAPLDTSTSAVTTTIENKRIVDLPLNGRNVLSLAVLVPGVTPGQGSAGSGAGRTPWISGGRNATSEVRLDGVATTVPDPLPGAFAGAVVPSVDSVEEFVIVTNTLAAEYGRTGGGAILLASKQGGNSLHGTAYEFLRNSKLDANDFFSNRAGIPLSALQRNQFGAAVGGPVFLPKIYDGRNRTFFFFNDDLTRQRTPDSLNTTVPLDDWKRGDFSNLRNSAGQAILIYDPLTIHPDGTGSFVRDPFAGNRIPESSMDPVARNMLKYYVQPNATPVNPFTQVNNFFTAGKQQGSSYNLTSRVDHTFTTSWRTFARFTRGISRTHVPNYFGNPGSPGGRGDNNSRQHAVSWDNTYTLNPRTIFDVNYGVARSVGKILPPSYGFDITTLGFPAYLRDQAARRYLRFPAVSISGLSALGQQSNAGNSNIFTTHNAAGSLTRIFSSHTVKAGVEYRKLYMNQWREGVPSGSFNFDEGWTQRDPVRRTSTEGFGLASMLLGLPSGGQQSLLLDQALASSYWAGFVQDDFRVSKHLTLNIGLRYEVDIPRTERYNRMSYFDLSASSPIAGQVPGYPNLVGSMEFTDANHRRQTPTDLNNVSPRFGFAYRIGSKMVARGGYGLMYAPSPMQSGTQNAGFEGFDSTTNMIVSLDGRTPIAYLRNPFPDGFAKALGPAPSPVSGAFTDLGLAVNQSWFPDYVNPIVQQWNFNLQRELPGGMMIEAGYLGSKGNHLIDGENSTYDQLPASFLALRDSLNDLVPNPFANAILNPLSTLSRPTVRRGQLLRPYPQYTAMDSNRRPTSNSLYHSFTIRFEKRFSRGLGFLMSFTGGKSIDDGGFGNTLTAENAASSRQDIYNRRADRSVSSEDISRRFVLSVNYELPFGRKGGLIQFTSTPLRFLFGGWQVNAITTLQSGLPVVLFQNANNTGLFTAAQRPNNNGHSAKIEGGTRDERLQKWFDPSVFSIAPPFTFGNAPRVLPDVRYPGVTNVDLSAFKSFLFAGERVKAQFRMEAFNALNKAQFGRAGHTVGTSTIGIISDTINDPRQVQLALKVIF
jgi:hypothetical protein